MVKFGGGFVKLILRTYFEKVVYVFAALHIGMYLVSEIGRCE